MRQQTSLKRKNQIKNNHRGGFGSSFFIAYAIGQTTKLLEELLMNEKHAVTQMIMDFMVFRNEWIDSATLGEIIGVGVLFPAVALSLLVMSAMDMNNTD